MKIRIEIQEDVEEEEVVIRCRQLSESVRRIHHSLMEASAKGSEIAFYKNEEEYYFPMHDVLFFETEGDGVYAHTSDDAYSVKSRLYELEKVLPREFVRISKTTIINVSHVYSVNRNLSSASLVRFHRCHKQVYASRLYYKEFKQRLDEMRSHAM